MIKENNIKMNYFHCIISLFGHIFSDASQQIIGYCKDLVQHSSASHVALNLSMYIFATNIKKEPQLKQVLNIPKLRVQEHHFPNMKKFRISSVLICEHFRDSV